jgi:predicted signal transduction protein with EAL and GGDEF domain
MRATNCWRKLGRAWRVRCAGWTPWRLGGDEFAVLLPNVVDRNATLEVATRLRTARSESFKVDGVDLDIDASIGVVLSGAHGDDAQTLLQRADVAMYVAHQLDDVGAGYTSLAQLKNLPISELEIDKSFILTMDKSADDTLIVKSMVDMGHGLNMKAVA